MKNKILNCFNELKEIFFSLKMRKEKEKEKENKHQEFEFDYHIYYKIDQLNNYVYNDYQ